MRGILQTAKRLKQFRLRKVGSTLTTRKIQRVEPGKGRKSRIFSGFYSDLKRNKNKFKAQME